MNFSYNILSKYRNKNGMTHLSAWMLLANNGSWSFVLSNSSNHQDNYGRVYDQKEKKICTNWFY